MPEFSQNLIFLLYQMRQDKKGFKRDWILEIHFIDKSKKIGGFFEQLLTK